MDESTPFGSCTQEQLEDFDPWVEDQGISTDDLQRMQNALNDMMRRRCNSREEHQYHLDQMNIYMEIQIVWESKKEYLTLQIPKKLALVYQSCERNPKIPPMTLFNQNRFYLKNGNCETRKYVLSLHKVHAFLFPENDLEELNTRWVRKTIKRFNLYTRYVVDYWKSLWALWKPYRR
ncbi:hypothetical protein Tco_1031877 [Tanacetum coccineum]|uniref:Uncharacterized protein n=1 Tax=Tanacetum coccineum TaxID=301880 RepID=A0ABQ5GAM3_9ASTR